MIAGVAVALASVFLESVLMSRLLCLTVAALSLVLSAMPESSQLAADEPDQAFEVRIEPAAPPGQPTVDDLLLRLDALEAEMAAPPAGRDRGLALMLVNSHLAGVNYYEEGGTRYFVTGLILINLSDEPITIPTTGIVLDADGQPLKLADAAAQLPRHDLQFGGGRLGRFTPPADSVIVPARGSAATTLIYAGIESASAVPALKLLVNWERGTETLDINAYQRGVLGLRIERLGPHNCGALLTINGELNAINAGHAGGRARRAGGGRGGAGRGRVERLRAASRRSAAGLAGCRIVGRPGPAVFAASADSGSGASDFSPGPAAGQ
jgi:hypothetical protein